MPEAIYIPEAFGPEYPALTAKVQKFRRMARDGLQSLPRETRLEYAREVETAILALQQSAIRRVTTAHAIHCASGTAHTCGRKIHQAMREKQRAALLAAPAQIRAMRSDEEWRTMYAEAMKAKVPA